MCEESFPGQWDQLAMAHEQSNGETGDNSSTQHVIYCKPIVKYLAVFAVVCRRSDRFNRLLKKNYVVWNISNKRD